ncbi:immune-associated nucleotide-binding protein 9-like [Papaver somniferum]|uniref:immune-associated nucleotide-binding protein 9-like n=1 Tax=Papaver somniferum TaxID=3469 RepID=UPI000E7026F1|nr:immune-associated nucleotide-binding protein 9-like [Papaver somniferum]
MVYYGLKVARTEDLVSLAAFNLTNSQLQRRKKKEKKCFGKIVHLNHSRTLVFLGKTGNGKSATGNNIFYKEDFNSECSLDGVTTKCELQSTTSPDGHILNMIDTPGLFGFSPGPTETIEEISRCINFAKNGIHAILFFFRLRIVSRKKKKKKLNLKESTHLCKNRLVLFDNVTADRSKRTKQVLYK